MKIQNMIAVMFLFIFTLSMAQSTDKLKELKGDVTKITVETTDGKVELTGEDAEKAFNRLKKTKKKNFVIVRGNEDSCNEITIDVDVDDNDGEKRVVIKKKIDGKETVQEFKGEEAEEYLKKHGDEHKMTFVSEDGDIHVITNGDDDLVWVSEDDADLLKKEINVEVEDGVKKVTVTTTKDGEKNVEVYEGEEAEKYLKEIDKGGDSMFIEDNGSKTVIKKKIIIKEEEHDDDN